MNYKITIVVDTFDEESARELMLIAKDAINDSIDLDEEDVVSATVELE